MLSLKEIHEFLEVLLGVADLGKIKIGNINMNIGNIGNKKTI